MEWKLVGKKFKNKTKKIPKNNIIIDSSMVEEINSLTLEDPPNIDKGTNICLPCQYVLWCHDIHSKDWNLSGYNNLCTISNVSQFWKLFNNIEKIGYRVNNFFLMKEGTDPLWEHENNRNGGVCSFKSDIESSIKIYEDLCVKMICNCLVNNPDDINGISVSPKNNWAIIKIWNKDKNNDLSKTLNPDILEIYKELSIKYKENEPEY